MYFKVFSLEIASIDDRLGDSLFRFKKPELAATALEPPDKDGTSVPFLRKSVMLSGH